MWKVLIFLTVLAVVYAQKKSECEESREKALKSTARPRAVVPKCKANGDYEALQCHEGSKFCSCWDTKGIPVTQPSGKLRHCGCPLKKHELSKPNPAGGAYVPTCTDEGKYTKKQCRGQGKNKQCWCVDEVTGAKKNEPSTREVTC